MNDLDATLPLTEQRNAATMELDQLSTLEMVQVINAEDAKVAAAVEKTLPAVAAAIDAISARMRRGGRLIYAGAGTSGRLGALDAAECPPTFSTPPDLVVALMAGSARAFARAVEGAEDDEAGGAAAITALDAGVDDSIVGIAASGRTPYVMGAMAEARRCGSLVVSIACVDPSPMAGLAEIAIAPVTGPEALTGSTRLKAGTAQKLVLNMISTGVMVRLGKTYGNLMVDMQPSNAKLRRRARRIVEQATGLDAASADALMARCDGEVKTAIVAALAGVSPEAARARLAAAGGSVRGAITPP
jgi:N-acetylmuramic acid 6-phosphate etherase